jgi:hypothetical protein
MQSYGKMLRSKKPFLGCGKPGRKLWILIKISLKDWKSSLCSELLPRMTQMNTDILYQSL